MDKINWGRWGAEDERGAANLITREGVRSAAGLVKTGEVIPLALPIKPGGVPGRSTATPPLHLMDIDGADYAAGARVIGRRTKAAQDYLMICIHTTTHIDALSHCWTGNEMYNGFPESSMRSTGAHKLGIEKLGAVVTRGVLLDLVERAGSPLADGYAISPDELEDCARLQGVQVRPGDALLVRTGWMERFLAQQADGAREPGLSESTAEWIRQNDIALVGADNTGIEVQPPEDEAEVSPLHIALIRDRGVYLLEQMNLAELASRRVYEFLFVAAPLQIRGGTGSPLTPLAVL